MKRPVARLRPLTLAVVITMASSPLVAGPSDLELPRGEWTGVSRVIAVGDIHGSYEKAIELLQGAGVIDESFGWIGGDQHLVAAGDLIDRGERDRQVMDLLRRLQTESAAAGGRVHVLLGNHESMTLMRDLRYLNGRAIAAWADEESESERKQAWRLYLNTRRGNDAKAKMVSDFQRDYPPGYFARLRSFDREGEYGSWLLGLPTIVKINGVVYVHGGVTVETASLGIDGINRGVQRDLVRHMDAREVLEEAGLVNPLMDFAEIRQIARAGVQRAGALPPQLRQAAQAVLDTSRGLFLSSRGPLWYRGSSFEDERIEREMLERSLDLLGAQAMVVAHSPTSSKKITSRFHGKLFKVDHNIAQSERLQALSVSEEGFLVIDASTHLTVRPIRELPIGIHGPRDPEVFSDRDLRDFLAQAEVVDSRYLGRGTTRPRLLELERNDVVQRGIFKSVSEEATNLNGEPADRYEHELAAYRLDRALGLNMVPVTVLRQIDGTPGSLQEWVEGAVDREASEAYDLGLFKSEEAAEQLARGLIFDALIGNHDRKPGDILCLVGGHRLYLIDHSKAFSLSTEIVWNGEPVAPVSEELLGALSRLDRPQLVQELSELLSDAQIDALLERRDQIVDRVTAVAGASELQISSSDSEGGDGR